MTAIKKNIDFPFELKNLYFFFGIVLFFYIAYLGQHIILPFVFSAIIAILLNPFVNYLVRKKINRTVAILMVLILTIILIAGMIFFLLSQMSLFSDTLPLWKDKFNILLKEFVGWISDTFNLSATKTNGYIDKLTSQGISDSTVMIRQTVSTVINMVITLVLVPVYIFLIIYYKQLLLTFISKIFSNDKHHTIVDVLNESKSLIQSYLRGLLIEAVIVAFLDSVTLFIIGIDYPILIGIICALLNVIPYIGGLVALILTMIFALATKSPLAAILVMVAHFTVQLIDDNILVPKILGSKVKINALAAILVVLIGGALFGVAGMFLSIPVTAIIKVICDRIEKLKPIGFLLGDTIPPVGRKIFNIKSTPEAIEKK